MLQAMIQPRLDAATPPANIQTGPVYVCFQCGQPVHSLTPWPVDHRNYSPLDDWAEHIAYLRLTCGCQNVSRVAKLGDAITPLRFHENVRDFGSWRECVYANIRAVREAVAFLAANVSEDERTSDPAARVVYGLLAGTLAPEQAIAQIRTMRLSGSQAGEGRHG
jgi:hypothetical protein